MIVHKKELKREKSKIILPKKLSTTLLPKKKKITINTTNMRKILMNFHKKNNISTILASQKIQNIQTHQDKVHSRCKHPFNKA